MKEWWVFIIFHEACRWRRWTEKTLTERQCRRLAAAAWAVSAVSAVPFFSVSSSPSHRRRKRQISSPGTWWREYFENSWKIIFYRDSFKTQWFARVFLQLSSFLCSEFFGLRNGQGIFLANCVKLGCGNLWKLNWSQGLFVWWCFFRCCVSCRGQQRCPARQKVEERCPGDVRNLIPTSQNPLRKSRIKSPFRICHQVRDVWCGENQVSGWTVQLVSSTFRLRTQCTFWDQTHGITDWYDFTSSNLIMTFQDCFIIFQNIVCRYWSCVSMIFYDFSMTSSSKVTNGKNAMPAFGERLGPDDIEDVANYVIDQANKGWPQPQHLDIAHPPTINQNSKEKSSLWISSNIFDVSIIENIIKHYEIN